jgi:hypothetical protein
VIEIFKTNVSDNGWAGKLVELLCEHLPGCYVNFDLDDCDKILRVEGDGFAPESVRIIANENGFLCERLD